MFVNANHFHPSLIFVGKARSLSFGYSLVWSSTQVGSGLAHTFYIREEVSVSDKHTSLLQYKTNYDRKKFKSAGPGSDYVNL